MIALKAIVHIMPDDKFIADFIRMSEKYTFANSSYLVLCLNKPRFVKTKNKAVNYIPVDSDYALNESLVYNLNKCKVIILHSFNWMYINFINKIDDDIKVIWIFWGVDGYNAIKKSKYLTMNSLAMQFANSPIGKLNFYARLFLNNFLLEKHKASRKIIKRADFCATFVKDDLYLAKQINPKIESLYFNYFNETGYKLLEAENSRSSKGNILLGNSANPTNDHSSALKHLLDINFKGKIYCPLSYSGSEAYINNVINYGKRSFGKSFIPITEFLKYEEYSKIISDCDIVLMNHIRQQAVGNIFKSMCLLKPVILNKRSYLRSTFLEWGIKIYDLDILNNQKLVKFSELTKNREIILKQLDEKNNFDFFDKILEISKSNIVSL
jgi:dTDP-N-acetylfucosamine:lipid II N-acetylfucosaminyltransferase